MSGESIPNCTGEQCQTYVDDLRKAFGGFGIDDREQRQLRRLFLDYAPREVDEAIAQLTKKADRRPSAHDLAMVLKANRRFLKSQSETTAPPQWDDPDAIVGDEVPSLASLAKACADPTQRAEAQAELDRRTRSVA